MIHVIYIAHRAHVHSMRFGYILSDGSDFVSPLLGEGCLVSLLYGPDRKPIIPNTLDNAQDPSSDGTGITHMAKRAMESLDIQTLSPIILTSFLAGNFTNSGRDQVVLVMKEIRRRGSMPSPVQSFPFGSPPTTTSGVQPPPFGSPLANTSGVNLPPFGSPLPGSSGVQPPPSASFSTPRRGEGDDLSATLLKALPQALGSVMEQMKSSQKGFQDTILFQQKNLGNQFQEAFTSQEKANAENTDKILRELAAQRASNDTNLDKLITANTAVVTNLTNEVAAQRTSKDAAAAREHKERMGLQQLVQQMQQQSSHANHVAPSPSPGFQQQPVNPRFATSASPLPAFHSTSSAYGYATSTPRRGVDHQQQSSGSVFPHATRVFSASGSGPAHTDQMQTFQEGQRVLYQKNPVIPGIHAIVVEVHDDDGTGCNLYCTIKFVNPQDIPQYVQEQERATYTKQTEAKYLSPVEGL
eukprot:scaffold34596_cov222-Amphora_coffeaeformis.AAC.1